MDPTLDDLIARVCRLVTEQGREHWWIRREVAAAFERHGYHLLPRHFYSPVPDPDTIATYDWSREAFPLSRLNFDEVSAVAWWRKLATYAHEIETRPAEPDPQGGYHWNNLTFAGLDTVALYGFVRELRPRRVIEIGSGMSTMVTLQALSANRAGRVTCIEPYPWPALLALGDAIDLHVTTAQQVPLELFEPLRANDILFIDSSHVSALGSDVNREVLELLPALAPGVYVHVHDIFFPRDYPAFWVDERRWFWNEQYLLFAFLLQNPSFEVVFPVQLFLSDRWSEVTGLLGSFAHDLRGGSSLWLRRRGA